MKKMFKKLTCGILATVSVFACATTLTACETSNPEVEMQIEFNGETYTLEYKLYRNLAPKTVAHFLWLANNGYYNGLCVHDYDTEDYLRMYTGAFEAGENVGELEYRKYYETIATYKDYKEFPHSVWADKEKTTPLYTLKGEFKDNNFVVESGALKETFGSLTMYYPTLGEDGETDVYMAFDAGEEGEVAARDYTYNCATSMFYISLSESSKTNNNYCTFATVQDDSKEELEELRDDIAEYVEDTYGENTEDFTTSESVNVYEDDKKLDDLSVSESYNVPKSVIKIKQIKVTKY